MKRFDSHLHIAAPEPLADAFAYHKDYLAGTDTERAVMLSIPSHADGLKYGTTSYLQNLKALFYKLAFPGRLYAFYGLEHDMTMTESERRGHFLRQVENAHAVGFDGVKLLEGKPSLRRERPYILSSPSYEDMLAYLEEKEIPVLLHNADPGFYWDKDKVQPWHITLGWYVEETQLRKHEMFEDVMTVLSRHPRLRLTMAHMGFTSDSIDDARRFMSYENTCFDTTPGAEQLIAMGKDWETWHPFFVEYQDRILYGTDRDGREEWDTPDWRDDPWCAAFFLQNFFLTDTEHILGEDTYLGVGIEKEIAEKIFYKNAYRILGEPREVNTAYFREKLAVLTKYYEKDEKMSADLAFIKKTVGM